MSELSSTELTSWFAAKNGKTTLYKFRPYATGRERRRVDDILVDHCAYFASSSQLNDPFDLAPRIMATDRESLVSAAGRYFDRNPERTDRKEIEDYLRTVDLDQHIADAQERIRRRFESDYPVFSLAGNRDHPMLWSHYAGGHTGLCIHFRADEQSIFGTSMRVQYVDERPMLPIELATISDDEMFQRVALRKGKFWEYEEEYRWLKLADQDLTGFPIRFFGQRAKFPSSVLSGITLGARMGKFEIDALMRIAADHNPTLPVWRAREKDTFEFEFERLA